MRENKRERERETERERERKKENNNKIQQKRELWGRTKEGYR